MDDSKEPLLENERKTVYDSIYPQPAVVINEDVEVIKDSKTVNSPAPETKLYKRRWYMLFVFSMIAFVQGGIWNTWGPIAASSEEAFGWSDADIALFANWGPIAYLIATFPFAWIIDVKGNMVCLI